VPHDTWGEVGIAFVVGRGDTAPTPGELSAHLASRLARYKLPKAFVTIDALPRTAYGKVQKNVLAERYAATRPPGGTPSPDSGGDA
jgi:fatty-acyl-CoA synthase